MSDPFEMLDGVLLGFEMEHQRALYESVLAFSWESKSFSGGVLRTVSGEGTFWGRLWDPMGKVDSFSVRTVESPGFVPGTRLFELAPSQRGEIPLGARVLLPEGLKAEVVGVSEPDPVTTSRTYTLHTQR